MNKAILVYDNSFDISAEAWYKNNKKPLLELEKFHLKNYLSKLFDKCISLYKTSINCNDETLENTLGELYYNYYIFLKLTIDSKIPITHKDWIYKFSDDCIVMWDLYSSGNRSEEVKKLSLKI
jgi:hypothetical protein